MCISEALMVMHSFSLRSGAGWLSSCLGLSVFSVSHSFGTALFSATPKGPLAASIVAWTWIRRVRDRSLPSLLSVRFSAVVSGVRRALVSRPANSVSTRSAQPSLLVGRRCRHPPFSNPLRLRTTPRDLANARPTPFVPTPRLETVTGCIRHRAVLTKTFDPSSQQFRPVGTLLFSSVPFCVPFP